MTINNPSFEIDTSSWTYEEIDGGGRFSGDRDTSWGYGGICNYMLNHSGTLTSGEYGRIKQNVTISTNRLQLAVRWWTNVGGAFTLYVKFGAATLWSKTMNIGNPSPAPIELVDIDMTSYNGLTDDLILEMKRTGSSGSANAWSQWDMIIDGFLHIYVNTSTGDDTKDGGTVANAVLTFGKAFSLIPDGGFIHVCNSGADFSAETVTRNKSYSMDLNGASGYFYGAKGA
jgi:hypothetical protein